MKKFVLFFIALFFVGVSFAQEKKLNVEEKKDGTEEKKSENVEAAKVAQNLANYGYANKNALSILSAAEILAKTALSEINPDKVENGKKVDESTKMKKTADALNPLSLIADARKMTNDKHLLAIADNVEKKIKKSSSSRGAAGGAKAGYKTVAGYSYVYYWVTFYGGSLAEVAVVGDGDTDLDLYIYDENGNLIVRDTSYGDNCYTSWRPNWTGSFKIKVRNRGSLYNKFFIATN
ncbi:MAG: hypothetical protein B6I24_04340 [Bacteroidetes bacterium 4572_128]|nr:MAG: hypothetical protein B6I24_04340 [Bacteroidetes bacterium 4572_128]